MEITTRERLINFVEKLNFTTSQTGWIELFEKEYANLGEFKSEVDAIVNNDECVYAGMINAGAAHKESPCKATDAMMNVSLFVLYLWYKKNVMNDPNIAPEFPEEI